MSTFRVSPEQRLALATAADRPRTEAEALVLARLADEQGMPGSAAAWREVAANGVATGAVRQTRHARPAPPRPSSGNARSTAQGVLVAIVIVLAALVTLAGCVTTSTTRSTPAPATVPVPSPAVAPVAAPVVEPARPAGRAVTRVIDGDTFEVEGGERVRLLGIDACEIGTRGGKAAKLVAESYLLDERVVLIADGARGRDRHGRTLARAEVRGVDVGSGLIMDPAIGVYQGRNDATPAYVADLRSRDDGPRNCADEVVTTASDPVYVEDSGDDDDRDRESRFCRKRWYC